MDGWMDGWNDGLDWWVYGKIDVCKNPSKVVACRDMKIVLTKCGHVSNVFEAYNETE